MDVYARLKELNIELPEGLAAAGLYKPVNQTGNLVFISGQGSIDHGKNLTGRVGVDVTVEDAQYAARVCAINTLAAGGILSTEEKSFYPSRPISRGQFAVLLCRALEIAPVEDGDNFADAGDTWYTPYLAALKQNGFASGGAQNNFDPERSLTRQELCTLIYNACGGFAEDPMTTFAPYGDSGDVASWAVQPMSWCIERGILETSGRNLLPEETVSRAQAAQSIYNLLYGSAALS